MLSLQKLGMKQNKGEFMKILFVCTGNTCRSPMAQAIAQNLYKDFEFSSAGLCANENDTATENAVVAIKEKGLDISSHCSKQLTMELIDSVDFIVPMTSSHTQMLLLAGVNENKILKFDEEIADPFGCSLEVYKNCSMQIEKNIKNTIGEMYDKNSK